MPTHHCKDISGALKHIVLAKMKTGMSYQHIFRVTRLFAGAVTGIVKVRVAYILGGGQVNVTFLDVFDIV